MDIGGTTTDVGVLQQGFPRPASTEAVLAGVRLNQRVPDIFSTGMQHSPGACKDRVLISLQALNGCGTVTPGDNNHALLQH